MFRSQWRCFAAFALLFCSLPLFATGDRPIPDEVSSAKSMALLVRVLGESPYEAHSIAQYRTEIESKAAAEIQKQNYFQLAPDPSKADLVCLLITYWAPVFREGKSFWNRSSAELYLHPPAAIMIFKGGNHPQWSAFPLWMKTTTVSHNTMVYLVKDFYKSVKKTKTNQTPGVAQGTHEDKETQEAKEKDGGPASKQPAEVTPTGPSGPDGDDHGDSRHKAEQDRPKSKAPDPAKAVTVFCQSDFKDCNPAKAIYSAKTLLVCDSSYKCNDENVHKALPPGGRWSLVQEPEKADLIVILSNDRASSPGDGGMLGGAQFSTMYLFKGGSEPDWQAMPLFTTVGGGGLFSKVRPGTGGTVLEKLQKFIADTQ